MRSTTVRWTSALLIGIALLLGCATETTELSRSQRDSIASEVEAKVRDAYDLSKPGSEQKMLALYADTGRIVSASGGRAIVSRDTIAEGIRLFWANVGSNMRNPKWIWTHTYVDVLAPNAVVFTGTYRVPHLTPRGEPHEIDGAMTLVFAKRGGKWGVVHEHLSDVPPAQMPMPTDSAMKMKGG
jgi:ketosteroid isomerase-like protein